MLLYRILYCYKIMDKFKKVTIFLLLAALFFSCSARIDGVLREGGAAELKLQTAMEPRTAALIRSLRGFMGETTNTPVMDGQAIGRSMAAAPGVRSVSLVNTGPEAMDGTISISNIGDFLASGVADNRITGNRFITFTEGRETSSVVVSLDRNSAPELIARLSPEI